MKLKLLIISVTLPALLQGTSAREMDHTIPTSGQNGFAPTQTPGTDTTAEPIRPRQGFSEATMATIPFGLRQIIGRYHRPLSPNIVSRLSSRLVASLLRSIWSLGVVGRWIFSFFPFRNNSSSDGRSN
jgi:hypothetical protein